MKKFSLLESKSSVYEIIGIDKEYILDVLVDMEDEGWQLKIEENFLSKSGRIFKDRNDTAEYYPCVSIELKRDKNKKMEGKSVYWLGGIYLEDNVEDLKLVYLTIDRIKRITENLGVNFNWGFRTGLDEIFMRLSLDVEKSESPLPKETIEDSMKGLEYLKIGDYEVTEMNNFRRGYNWTIEVKPIKDKINDIIKRSLSNLIELPNIVNHILKRVGNSSSSPTDIELRKCGALDFLDAVNDISTISFKDKTLFIMDSHSEKLGTARLKVDSGFFKDKYETITIYGLEISFKY